MKVWKYPLRITADQKVEMPAGSEILSVKMEKSQLCLWALVSPAGNKETRYIEVFGTGHHVEPGTRKYLGTVQDHGLVWHVFEAVIEG